MSNSRIVSRFRDVPVGALYTVGHLGAPFNARILLKYDTDRWLYFDHDVVADASRVVSERNGCVYVIRQEDVDVYQHDVVAADTLIANRVAERKEL